MSGPAQVRSVSAIEEFRAALAKFELAVQDSLDGLDAQLRRAVDWVEHDRPAHWRRQVRRSEDQVHQAKLELERCLMFPVAGERPACREERAALKEAQDRLDYCRAKVQRVAEWRRQLQHELFEYHGRVGQLRQLLEIDLPRARGALHQILRRLEEYRMVRPPAAGELPLSDRLPQRQDDAPSTPPASQAPVDPAPASEESSEPAPASEDPLEPAPNQRRDPDGQAL